MKHFVILAAVNVTFAASARVSYYYKSRRVSEWRFGKQYSIEGSPFEMKEHLAKTEWFT